MSSCACCNRPMAPEWAYEHNTCPVCWQAGCTSHHAEHSDRQLEVHAENAREQAEQTLTEEQQRDAEERHRA